MLPILDGQLVARAGLPEDFYALGGRMARRGNHLAGAVSITFVAFDVLWLDAHATTALPTVNVQSSSKAST